MSLHEVTIAMSAIIARKEKEMKFQAACLGAEFKDDKTSSGYEALTDKQKLAIKKAVDQRRIK